ncbi:MAG TPA: hypothetical protein VGD81_17060 [Opitutaceae bacterium]
MTAKQTNILNMAHAVMEKLDGLVAANPLPALVAKSEGLKTRLAAIGTTAALQALPTTGRTMDRNQVFASAVAATQAVAGSVRSYARTNHLADLEAKVTLNGSSFRRTRFAHRVPLMRQVYEAAESVLAQLADFGVTAEVLAGLKMKIDAADVAKGEPRSMIVDRGVATEQLADSLRALADFLVHEVDPLVDSMRETHPAGWAAYHRARNVIDQPGTSAKPEEGEIAATAEKLAA